MAADTSFRVARQAKIDIRHQTRAMAPAMSNPRVPFAASYADTRSANVVL